MERDREQNGRRSSIRIVKSCDIVSDSKDAALLKQAEYMEAQSNRLANAARELRQMILKSK